MIDKFGKVMIYVKNPRTVADFWVEKIGFTEIKANMQGDTTLSVELSPDSTSDAGIVLFDRDVVAKMSPELSLGTPSILFSSYDVKGMRDKLLDLSVNVGEIMEMGGMPTFNFSDPEGNYFAVGEIER